MSKRGVVASGVLWRVFIVLVVFCASGCTRIQTYFPDKQIEYRNSTELPVLEIPVDLRNNALERQLTEVKRAAQATQLPSARLWSMKSSTREPLSLDTLSAVRPWTACASRSMRLRSLLIWSSQA